MKKTLLCAIPVLAAAAGVALFLSRDKVKDVWQRKQRRTQYECY